MNKNFFSTALRILKKNKAYTLINIVGLGLGFSVSILLLTFVYDQLSHDRFHEHYNRLGRLTVEGAMNDGKVISGPITMGEMADLLAGQVPEIMHISRLYPYGSGEVVVEDERFTGIEGAWVDSAFFQMFSFPLLEGDPVSALRDPFTVVLTEATAHKLFGSTDAMGKTVQLSGRDYRITGVMKDVPRNSHMRLDLAASFHSLVRPDYNVTRSNGISFPTYILLREDADPARAREKILSIADERIQEAFGPYGIYLEHRIQPMKDIHLRSNFSFSMGRTGDIRHVYIFGALALFVLVTAVFNYVNLVTAQSEKRAREIGMRKVIGAGKPELIRQFIGESIILSGLAFLLALLLNQALIGPFTQLMDADLPLIYWQKPAMLAGIVLFVVLTGVIAGVYPAFYLSRFQPVVVLKGTQHGASGRHAFRKVLVSLQFAISIFLIASLLLVHRQVGYMKHKDLGFQRENVITVGSLTQTIGNSYESLKAELLQHPGILSVTASQSVPGRDRSLQNSYKKGDDPATAIMMFENRIRHDYIKTYNMQLVAGQDFDPAMRTDSAAFIINETAARKLGLVDPVGQEIHVWEAFGRIIGVVADFNFMSMHNEIDPLVFSMYNQGFSRISIRISPGDIQEKLGFIRDRFAEADPNYTFTYDFVDQEFEAMYQQEERISKLITATAVLAVIISFMGLFGLTSFTVSRRIKEIGIRKTLGASTGSIVMQLSGQLWRWILAGNLLAWPAAYLILGKWLENFAFRIDLLRYWWLFAAAGLAAALIGSIAMLYQSLSAIRSNPVNSLRSE